MTDATCSVLLCPKQPEPERLHGMCSMHAWRAKHGLNLLWNPGAQGRAIQWVQVLVASGPWADDCIHWPANRLAQGYGRLWFKGRKRVATQVVLELLGHEQPTADHRALHSCDTPSCVNPLHLRWGTPSDNAREMYDRGRRRTAA